MRASSPMAERGATELEQLVAVENLGGRGRLVVIVVFDRMVLEGEAFVEFDERNREVDFGEGEGVAVLQDEDVPSVRGADMNGSANPGLLEHHITLDRRRRLIFARLDDAVGGGGARAQHLEDHDGIADDLEGRIKTGANHHSVRVATAVFRRLDLEVAAEELAWLSAQPGSERHRKIALDGGMGEASACHCDGFGTVEFVALLLPLLPCEEFGERHRLPHREVHGRQISTVAHRGLPWLWLTASGALSLARAGGRGSGGLHSA